MVSAWWLGWVDPHQSDPIWRPQKETKSQDAVKRIVETCSFFFLNSGHDELGDWAYRWFMMFQSVPYDRFQVRPSFFLKVLCWILGPQVWPFIQEWPRLLLFLSETISNSGFWRFRNRNCEKFQPEKPAWTSDQSYQGLTQINFNVQCTPLCYHTALSLACIVSR